MLLGQPLSQSKIAWSKQHLKRYFTPSYCRRSSRQPLPSPSYLCCRILSALASPKARIIRRLFLKEAEVSLLPFILECHFCSARVSKHKSTISYHFRGAGKVEPLIFSQQFLAFLFSSSGLFTGTLLGASWEVFWLSKD